MKWILMCLLIARCVSASPPNIVWLSVEDMSPWIGAYDDHTVPTPNLDRLAAEGTLFTNAFATSPVCAPARSSLITGMYATRIGTLHMRNGSRSSAAEHQNPDAYANIPQYEGVLPPFVRCFPEILRRHGYYCTNNAKTDYQFRAPVTVWDESSGKAHWRNRAEGQPFFAVFNHAGTHESGTFESTSRAPEVVTAAEVPIPPIYPDTPAVRETMARTYNRIARMDGWVGSKLEELERAGLLDSTIIFFFSDHGVGLPRGKRSCYDTGTRVPFIVWTPGGPGGRTDERVVSFVDFGPTVLSLAGVKPDHRLDGVPFLGAHARESQSYAFAHADRFDSVYDHVRTVSDGRYRLILNLRPDLPHIIANAYRERVPMTRDLYALRGTDHAPEQWQVASTERPAIEFYDSATDPWEVVNLADRPEHHGKIQELTGALHAWMTLCDDMGEVLPESRLVEERIWPPEGVQPTTTPGVVRVKGGIVTIECEEPGASIAFRLSNTEEFDGPWTPYFEPTPVSREARWIQVRTHRIGYRPTQSEVPME